METNFTTTIVEENNHTKNYKHHHPLKHKPVSHPQHDIFPSTTILIVILPIIIVILLFSIILILLMLKRLKSENDSKTSSGLGSGDCMFNTAHSTININASPDIKGGCLYKGNSVSSIVPNSIKFKGVQVFTYKELESATDRFSEGNVIGSGGFGVVYKGVLKDGYVAAVKRFHKDGKQGERAFRIEVDLLSRLHSQYLVEMLGYCADQHHRLLIFDFMPNGSLLDLLHTHKSRLLNWGTRLMVALDCARALEYLHEHTSPSVIHRDFKSSNVLLDHNFRAKVTDFGLAKTGSDRINGLISTRVLGTTGYLAPEYASTGKLTTKSDTYSYGVVLLELLTGRIPVDTKRPPGEHVLVSWALPRLTNRDKVVEMVDPSLQGQFSKKDLIQVAAIAAMCVQAEADYRPLMTDVVQSLIPLVKNFSSGFPSNSFRCKS